MDNVSCYLCKGAIDLDGLDYYSTENPDVDEMIYLHGDCGKDWVMQYYQAVQNWNKAVDIAKAAKATNLDLL